jgi:hypothetical protein
VFTLLAIGATFAVFWRRRMNRPLPIVIFDTGAHNRLAKNLGNRNHLFTGIRSRYFFRLAGLSYEEMASTPDLAQRRAFLNDTRRLKEGPWDCLNPVNEVLRLLIAAHTAAPEKFNWLAIDVRSGELNHEITVGSLTADDELAEQQRNAQKASLQEYKGVWVSLRPKLDSAFAAAGKPRPTTFKDTVNEYGPSLLPGFAKGLYDAGLRTDAALRGETVSPDTSPEVVQHFIDNCPPFRATLYAFLMSWYQHSARDESGEKFKAGRNDLFMATYPPVLEEPANQQAPFCARPSHPGRCSCMAGATVSSHPTGLNIVGDRFGDKSQVVLYGFSIIL